jgi:hypothetical protein
MNKFLLLTFVTLFSLSSFAQPCNTGTETKILLIGDSWANFMHLNQSINDALDNHGFTDLVQLSDNNLTSAGARTTDLLDTAMLADIRTAITDNPDLEFVHLSIGGNDVIYTWDVNFSAQATEVLLDTVFNRVERIISFIHSVNPNLEVVWSGYVYTNFSDVIGSVPGFLQSQHPYYATWSGMGFPDVITLNNLLRTFSERFEAYALQHPKVHFVKALGLMQYLYGQLTPLSVPPSGTYSPGLAAIDTGIMNYPSPAAAMITLGTIPFTGVSLTDCFHLNPNSFESFMDYQFDQFYMQKLMLDSTFRPQNSGSVNQNGVSSASSKLGNMSQVENRMFLDFNYNLPDTGISEARLFLKRKLIQNGNVLNQASSIQVDLFPVQSGSGAAFQAEDFATAPDTSFTVCTFGSVDKNDSWVRLDLPTAAFGILQYGDFQMRISATAVNDEQIDFYRHSDGDNAPILDLKYGPKVNFSVAVNETASESEIIIYPNPVTGNNFYVENEAVDKVEIYNANGQKINSNFDKNNFKCTILESISGILFVRMLDSKGRTISKNTLYIKN